MKIYIIFENNEGEYDDYHIKIKKKQKRDL